MIKINDLQRLQVSINYLRDSETLDKDSVVDSLDEIFNILLKMNKMEIKTYDYSYDTYIVKKNEE